jgi:hypothetical protein
MLEVGCAGLKALLSQLTTVKRHNANQVIVIVSFSVRVSESLSDNIQRGALRNRMTVTKGSSSTLQEEEDENDEPTSRVRVRF